MNDIQDIIQGHLSNRVGQHARVLAEELAAVLARREQRLALQADLRALQAECYCPATRAGICMVCGRDTREPADV